MIDPRLFFLSSNKLQDSIKLLKEQKDLEIFSGKPLVLSRGEYKRINQARAEIKSAILDNGDIIPRPMRLCAFIYLNLPIVCGFLIAPPTYG